MALKAKFRSDSKTLQIIGTIRHPDGSKQYIRIAPTAKTLREAQREAELLQHHMTQQAILGKKQTTVRLFEDAVDLYLKNGKKSVAEEQRILRVLAATPPRLPLKDIDREYVINLKAKVFEGGDPAPATFLRSLVTPIRAVLNFAADELGWCDPPRFRRMAKQPQGRTNFLLPASAIRLLDASVPHARDLFLFYICTGARASEAAYLEWSAVDVEGAKVTFWGTRIDAAGNKKRGTKQGVRRVVVDLPPVLLNTLSRLREAAPKDGNGHPIGRVFRRETMAPLPKHRHQREAPLVRDYAERNYGGGICRAAFLGAVRRAGLDPKLTLHDLRHTWASWHYALNKDLLMLKRDGAWSSVNLVERYAHLMPAGQEAAIRAFLAGDADGPQRQELAPPVLAPAKPAFAG